MNGNIHRVLLGLLGVVTVAASCSGVPDKSLRGAPVDHRFQGSPCPAGRGPGISAVPPTCSQDLTRVACTADSACSSGANGRCLQTLGPVCGYACSYDECGSDSDCLGNAPCLCRGSNSDTSANTCATESNCRVDADCGAAGFCSPSLLGPCNCVSETFCDASSTGACTVTGPDGVTKSVPCLCTGKCGNGYFCHTANDSCLNDADCAQGTCKFDLISKAWMCTRVICPP